MAEKEHTKGTSNLWPEGLWQALMDESIGLLEPGEVARIERDLTEGELGKTRREALQYLELGYGESKDRVVGDREEAIKAEVLLKRLSRDIASYESLALHLNAARTRLMVQLCKRRDSDEITEEANLRLAAAKPH